jgi:hypothetical protein
MKHRNYQSNFAHGTHKLMTGYKKKKKIKKLRKKAFRLIKKWQELGELIIEPLISSNLELVCKFCSKPVGSLEDAKNHTMECENKP